MAERLGDHFAASRRGLGLTQRELAIMTGVPLGTVRDLEQGRTVRPDAAVLRRLTAVLGTRPDLAGHPTGGSGVAARTDAGAPRVAIEVLGPLRVVVAGRERLVDAERLRTLLGLLALTGDRPVETVTIVETLWGEQPPDTAANLVQTYVSRLRRLLRPTPAPTSPDRLLVRSADGYRLAVTPDELDLLRFQGHVRQAGAAAAKGDRTRAFARYREALAEWSGDPVTDVAALRGHPRAVRLQRERLTATVEYAALGVALGAHREVLAALEAAAEAEPLHDAVHAQLMLALAGEGNRVQALRVFEEFRRRIAEELGVDPDPVVLAAHRQVLSDAAVTGAATDPPRENPDGVRTAAAAPDPARPGRTPAGGVLPVPRQLPAGTADFTGRTYLLDRLDTVLCAADANLVAVLSGSAGVGKTALATHWAHRVASRFPDGHLYLNLRGYATGDPAQPLTVLALFLRALGLPPQQVPSDVDEAAALYRSVLADRRVLLVLDNAASAEQVRPLLPGSHGCRALVTSRDRLTGLLVREAATPVYVDVLSEREAVHLLTRIIGPARADPERGAVAHLARMCARLPLALRIAGTNLAEDPHLSVAGYVHRLTVGNRLDELASEDDPGTAVRTTFDLSYLGLDPFSQRVFGLLGSAPGAELGVEALAVLAGAARDTTYRALRRLTRAHLAEQPTPDRFTCHDLLRLYAREQLPDRDRRASVTLLLDWYLARVDAAARLLYPALLRLDVDTGFEFLDRTEALEWLDGERHNLVAAIRYAADHDHLRHAFHLSDALRGYFVLRRPIGDWTLAANAGLAAAELARDERGQLMAHRNLANLHQSVGRQRTALRHHAAALRIAGQCGWVVAEVGIRNDFATTYIELGQLRTAAEMLTAALSLCAQADVPHVEVHLRNNLAVTLLRMGSVESALEHLEQVLRLAADQEQLTGLAMANMAEAGRLLRRYRTARDLLGRALDIHRAMGNRYGEADVLVILSRVQRETGQARQALDTARQALVITVEAGDRNTEARAYQALGEALRECGAAAEAIAAHRTSLRIASAVADQYLVTEAHLGLAAAYHDAGNTDLARRYTRVAASGARRGGFRLLLELAHSASANG